MAGSIRYTTARVTKQRRAFSSIIGTSAPDHRYAVAYLAGRVHPISPHNSYLGNSSLKPTCFSTLTNSSEDNGAGRENATYEAEMEELFQELNMWAKAGQPRKVQEVLEKRTQNMQLSQAELTRCYNCILFGWSCSKTVDAAEMAQQVLDNMPVPPSLQSLGYVLECWSNSQLKKKTGKQAGKYAEQILRQIQATGSHYDPYKAYHLALKACARGGDGDRAMKLLKELIKQQQNTTNHSSNSSSRPRLNPYILSSVLMAMKTRPSQAEELLESFHRTFGVKPDVVHYGIVLDAWANKLEGARVEALINKMLAEGIKVDAGAYNALLFAWRRNLDRMEELFRAMVDDYLNCPFRKNDNHSNNTNNTVDVTSHQIPVAVKPNVEGLSRVLAAMAQGNDPERAEALLHSIVNDPEIRTFLQPNVSCYSSVLNAWARAQQPMKAENLLRRMQQEGFELNVVAYTTVLHAWAIVGNFQKAEAIWNELMNHPNELRPNLYSLNILLLAYANAKPKPQPELAQQALKRAAQEANLRPDVASYSTVLRAWESANRPDKARALLEELRQKEVEENKVLLDVISYNIVFQAYSKAGMPEEAEELLSSMLQSNSQQSENVRPNAQCFSQVLSAYNRSKNPKHRQIAGKRAEEILQQMDEEGIAPNAIAFNVMLNCFSTSGYPERAESILKHMIENESADVDEVSANTCLHAWARSGNALRAEQLLLDLATADDNNDRRSGKSKRKWPLLGVQSFSIVLFAWAKQGTVESAMHAEDILRHMSTLEPRCKPDTVAFNTAIRAWMNVVLNNPQNQELVLRCAERADLLLSEMEELHQVQGLGKVRPDRLSFEPVVRMWNMGGNSERAKKLEARAQTLRIQ